MSSRREVLLGAAGALSAGLLGGSAEPERVSYRDVDDVRSLNVTGHGCDDAPDVLGLEHLTGFDELEISTSGDATTLRVDAETTSAVSVRAEAEVSRAQLVALRREIDAALREEY